MFDQESNINELDDLLRKLSISDKETFEKNSELLQKTVFNEEHSSSPSYEKGEDIVQKLEDQFIAKPTKRLIPIWFKYAAILIILIGVAVIYALTQSSSEEMKVVATSHTNKSKFYLPDSSQVWLNKDSKLSFLPSFKDRVVYLEGEAFFDVTKRSNQSFRIFANNSNVEVLGTSFNVSTDSETKNVEVVVIKGQVILSSEVDNNKNIILNKGDMGLYNNKEDEVSSIKNSDPNVLAWKTERLVFDRLPFSDVVKTLSEFYEKEIIINDELLGHCDVITTFDNVPFSEVLNELKLILNIEYNFKGDKVIVTGEGCGSIQ